MKIPNSKNSKDTRIYVCVTCHITTMIVNMFLKYYLDYTLEYPIVLCNVHKMQGLVKTTIFTSKMNDQTCPYQQGITLKIVLHSIHKEKSWYSLYIVVRRGQGNRYILKFCLKVVKKTFWPFSCNLAPLCKNKIGHIFLHLAPLCQKFIHFSS